jgi:hypothetical protein
MWIAHRMTAAPPFRTPDESTPAPGPRSDAQVGGDDGFYAQHSSLWLPGSVAVESPHVHADWAATGPRTTTIELGRAPAVLGHTDQVGSRPTSNAVVQVATQHCRVVPAVGACGDGAGRGTP